MEKERGTQLRWANGLAARFNCYSFRGLAQINYGNKARPDDANDPHWIDSLADSFDRVADLYV